MTKRPGWLLPAGLIVYSLIPVLAGAARVAQLSGDTEVTPDNERFFASPVPVVVHIVGITVYCLLGAFQFAPQFRGSRPGWHRAAGRLLIPCGLAAAMAGLWMTFIYPPAEDASALLTAFRLVFASAWILFLVLGFAAIRRRDIARHRAWMIRGYAIAMGTNTQAVTLGFGSLILGELDWLSNALLMLAGWVIALAVAERFIRRIPTRRAGAPGRLVSAMENR
jgi:hypothetical protein